MTPQMLWRMAQVAAVIGLVLLLVLGYRSCRSGEEAKSALDSSQRTDQAVSETITDIVAGTDEEQEESEVISEARDEYQRGYKDAKREDKAVADIAHMPIPERLRQLARERREARERP